MEIRVGWATEFGREKFDVSLDEGDLTRILGEYGITPARLKDVTVPEAFGLLRSYACWLACLEAAQRGIDPSKQAEADRYARSVSESIGGILNRLGVATGDGVQPAA